VIVGAGFIGCEVAATLRRLGVEQVTVIDIALYPMPALGPEVGRRAVALHERHGVRLRLGTSVSAFEGRGRIEAVTLADGERLDADFVLLALGSLPNTEWLIGSGLQLDRGTVRVDEHCIATGTTNVAAAGDIALYPHPGSSDELVCIEHWQTPGTWAHLRPGTCSPRQTHAKCSPQFPRSGQTSTTSRSSRRAC
jgi:NADPH-dependent 2,4-dienoyl-CoA reductase/sulfur reductase-like enzyme